MSPKQIVADAKCTVNWMSKLSCKRGEYQNESGREAYIYNSADSLSFEIDWGNMEEQQFPNSKSYLNSKSLPVCTPVCKKHTEEEPILHSFSTDPLRTNEDHSCHASVEIKGTFPSERLGEATYATEAIRRETLSPSVQLLHEIHLQRGCTGTDDIAISDNLLFRTNSMNDDDRNKYTSYRQRMRYEAIKKELFDDSTLETIDQETLEDYENEYFYGDDYLVTSDALDRIECQAASLWSCIPNMSKFFVPNLREGEPVDGEGDSISGAETQDASVSDIDEVSVDCSNKHTRYIRFPDQRGSSPDILDKSCDDSFHIGDSVGYEESSYSGSYMDQSHIYLMMTNVRQERSAIYQSQFEKTKEQTHSTRLKESDLTKSVGLHWKSQKGTSGQRGQTTAECNESPNHIDSWWGQSPFVASTDPDSSQPWMRRFKNQFNTNECHESETDHVQKRWLNLISQTLAGDAGSCLISSNQKERCEAAKEALQRMAKKKTTYRCISA
jgi:hypothetical protein